jgi:hypothetical protein
MDIPKNFKSFQLTLTDKEPNYNWPDALRSLWYDGKGNWEASHNIAQEMHNDMGSWIHAYLHRKEGDEFNAGYWYRQAGKIFPTITLEEEHQKMVEFLLSN